MSSIAPILALLAAQPGPAAQPRLDPALPDAVRPIVKEAIAAELDEKRGPANAIALLKSEIEKRGNNFDEQIALRLRHAAVELRRTFLRSPEFPQPIRYEQCMSTFARLDITDPGLKPWLVRTLANHKYAKAQLGKKEGRVLKATMLVRGPDLDAKAIKKRFKKAFSDAGFELRFVPAKQATLIMKLAAESAQSPDASRRAVRVGLGLESIKDNRAVWQHGLQRTEAAKDLDVAIDAALTWLVKIGGRDMLFRWLGERAFPSFLQRGKVSPATGHDLTGKDDGHGH